MFFLPYKILSETLYNQADFLLEGFLLIYLIYKNKKATGKEF